MVGAHALGGHDLGDAVLRLVEALRGAVLERLGARLGGDPLRHRRERVRREGARVRQAAGERDHLGPRAVTAIRSRIAEDFMTFVREANRPA